MNLHVASEYTYIEKSCFMSLGDCMLKVDSHPMTACYDHHRLMAECHDPHHKWLWWFAGSQCIWCLMQFPWRLPRSEVTRVADECDVIEGLLYRSANSVFQPHFALRSTILSRKWHLYTKHHQSWLSLRRFHQSWLTLFNHVIYSWDRPHCLQCWRSQE